MHAAAPQRRSAHGCGRLHPQTTAARAGPPWILRRRAHAGSRARSSATRCASWAPATRSVAGLVSITVGGAFEKTAAYSGEPSTNNARPPYATDVVATSFSRAHKLPLWRWLAIAFQPSRTEPMLGKPFSAARQSIWARQRRRTYPGTESSNKEWTPSAPSFSPPPSPVPLTQSKRPRPMRPNCFSMTCMTDAPHLGPGSGLRREGTARRGRAVFRRTRAPPTSRRAE